VAISVAAVTFYLCCRLLRVEEAAEAVDVIVGRFSRVLRRK